GNKKSENNLNDENLVVSSNVRIFNGFSYANMHVMLQELLFFRSLTRNWMFTFSSDSCVCSSGVFPRQLLFLPDR
ncbi:MAG: hypothetical protein ABWY27_02435, partial [Telluria sp.]